MPNAPGQGRKAKASTIAEKQRGNLPSSEQRRLPTAPKHLSDVAKAEWKRMGKMLLDAGLFTNLDGTALSTYCVAYGRWVEAEQALQEYGVVIKAPSGFPIQSPYLAISNKAMDQMIRLMGEFGLTPASRVRIPNAGKDKKVVPRVPKLRKGADPREYLKVVS